MIRNRTSEKHVSVRFCYQAFRRNAQPHEVSSSKGLGVKVYPLSRTQRTLETIRFLSGCSSWNRPITQPVQVL